MSIHIITTVERPVTSQPNQKPIQRMTTSTNDQQGAKTANESPRMATHATAAFAAFQQAAPDTVQHIQDSSGTHEH